MSPRLRTSFGRLQNGSVQNPGPLKLAVFPFCYLRKHPKTGTIKNGTPKPGACLLYVVEGKPQVETSIIFLWVSITSSIFFDTQKRTGHHGRSPSSMVDKNINPQHVRSMLCSLEMFLCELPQKKCYKGCILAGTNSKTKDDYFAAFAAFAGRQTKARRSLNKALVHQSLAL